MTDYSKRAKQLLVDRATCASAIAEAFSDITDKITGTTTQSQSPVPEDSGTCHDLCGAIHGICIVAVKIYAPHKAKTIVSKLTRKFRKKFGALTCHELSPDGDETQVPAVDRMPLCTEYVGYAAEILAQQLFEDGIIK